MDTADEELSNEIDVINSIFQAATLQRGPDPALILLTLPSHAVTLRIRFPPSYPHAPPTIEGIHSVGASTAKGYGTAVLEHTRTVLGRTWTPGQVCIYDLILELNTLLQGGGDAGAEGSDALPAAAADTDVESLSSLKPAYPPPEWFVSAPATEKKSVFVGRVARVASKAQAAVYIAHLLATDKKAAKATHNISAYLIRGPVAPGHSEGPVYMDYDDDGETAAGGRLAHLLRIMEAWGALVVVSRWYGGVKLGPDRFRIINQVAREALVRGGWKGKEP